MPRKSHAQQDREHRKTLHEVNEGKGGEDLRGIIREVAEEEAGRPGRAVAEINETSDGFVILVVMDPRTGYYRDFFMGTNRPLAERVSYAIRSGMGMKLPDGYIVEPTEGHEMEPRIRRE